MPCFASRLRTWYGALEGKPLGGGKGVACVFPNLHSKLSAKLRSIVRWGTGLLVVAIAMFIAGVLFLYEVVFLLLLLLLFTFIVMNFCFVDERKSCISLIYVFKDDMSSCVSYTCTYSEYIPVASNLLQSVLFCT